MNMEKFWFIIRRNIFRNKLNSFLNILFMSVIFIVVLTGTGVISFFKEYSLAANKYNKALRTSIVSTNDAYSEKDVISVFSGYDFIDMVIDQNEYETVLDYVNADGNYDMSAKACTEKSMPVITCGSGLDFSKQNEIILPEKMTVYNSNTGEYCDIDAKKLIGSEIKCAKGNYFCDTYYDEEKNAIVSGNMAFGASYPSFEVVGTYDSDMYFEGAYTGYISYETAISLHASDIKNVSGNYFETLWIISDKAENNEEVRKIAAEHGLRCSPMCIGNNRLTFLIISGIVIVALMIIFGFALANISAKIDIKKNISGYVIMRAFGYRSEDVCFAVFGKYLVLYFFSFAAAIPVSVFTLGKINGFFNSTEDMGGLSVDLPFTALLAGILLCVIVVVYIAFTAYIPISDHTVRDVYKNI